MYNESFNCLLNNLGLESTTIRPISANFNLPQDQIPISEEMTNVLYHESTERFMKEVLYRNGNFTD